MARKQPESEQVEELSPQGIPENPRFAKLQQIGDEKIESFLEESPSWGHYVDTGDLVKVHYEFFRSTHDKHMMDSLMWEIHRELRAANYPIEAGVGVIVNLYLRKENTSPENNHPCGELQGVEHED